MIRIKHMVFKNGLMVYAVREYLLKRAYRKCFKLKWMYGVEKNVFKN